MASVHILIINVLFLAYLAPAFADNTIYAFACEGATLNLECETGVINVIRENYGRTSTEICNHHPSYNRDLNCVSNQTEGIVHSNCFNKPSCSLPATNAVFGDPCVNTYKYLEVEYNCIREPSILHHAVVCEGSTLNIGCEPGFMIDLMRTTYGRLSTTVCNCDGSKAVHDTHCISTNSYHVVDSRCYNQQSCSVPATNSVFGDPCVGTYKYLTVTYQCIPQ